MTAFVLRYRLFREDGSPDTIEDARADTERAIRKLRSKAVDYNLDPSRVGIMAFSAGGELARMALLSPPVPALGQTDAIDNLPSRPDFGILVYPGPLKGDIETVTKNAPSLFMVAANDDECCSEPIIDILSAYNKAGARAEAHIYAEGGHAFNMGKRTKTKNLAIWPERLSEWMEQAGLLDRRVPEQ